MSETQTAEQIEAEARAEQEAARAASLERKNKGGRPPKAKPPVEAPPVVDEQPEKSTLQKQAINKEAADARRIERLKAARLASAAPAEADVKVRITKRGDGKISTGEHEPGLGDLTYEHREEVSMPRGRALELEEQGFVEIQDD
jgi:hypothetical protein